MRSVISSLLLGLVLLVQTVAQAAGGFTLTSTAFKDGGKIPMAHVYNSMGCHGGNHSPELSWSGAPAGTKSFAVTEYDPEANTGSGWWHWTVFNIPANVNHLPADIGVNGSQNLPKGAVQGRNDFGDSHYDGSCPPATDPPHHYHFTVYALKVDKLPVDENASGAKVGNYIHMYMLDKAVLIGVSSGSEDHQ